MTEAKVDNASIDVVIKEVATKELETWLNDVERQQALVNWLHRKLSEELGEGRVPKLAIRLAVKLLSMLISKTIAGTGRLLSDAATARIKRKLDRFPFVRRICELLRGGLPDLSTSEPIDIRAAAEEVVKPLVESFASLDASFREGLDEILNELRKQPQLSLHIRKNTESNRLIYGARRTRFVGRELEMSKLVNFLNEPTTFSWMAIGGGGGSGKSRLALELCLSHGGMWRAGFISPSHASSFDWNSWIPEGPTLIVCDYVESNADVYSDIAYALADKGKFGVSVRMLLLERDVSPEASWRRHFMKCGDKAAALRDVAYEIENPLCIGALSNEDRVSIFREIIGDDEEPSFNDLALLHQSIDPECRPLFAAFIAYAVKNGEQPRRWSKEELISFVLDRELEFRWKPAGINEKDINLLCLSTMVNGLSVENLNKIESTAFPKKAEFLPFKFALMAGIQVDTKIYPLQPDVLGELFVLENLHHKNFNDAETVDNIISLAWNDPLNMSHFVLRCSKDWLNHPFFLRISRPQIGSYELELYWARIAPDLIIEYHQNSNIDMACKIYQDLAIIAGRYGHVEFAVETLCAGTHFLLYPIRSSALMNKYYMCAFALFPIILQFPKNEFIIKSYLYVCDLSMFYCLNEGMYEVAIEYYNLICSKLDVFLQYLSSTESFLGLIRMYLIHYSKFPSMPLDSFYDNLCKIEEMYPGNHQLERVICQHIAYDYLYSKIKIRDWFNLDKYNKLKSIVLKGGSIQVEVDTYAAMLGNLISKLSKLNERDKVNSLLKDLFTCRNMYPESQVASDLSEKCSNIMRKYKMLDG